MTDGRNISDSLRFYKVSYALADHNRRRVGICSRTVWHDRKISYTQSFETVNLTVLIRHSHRIVSSTHSCRARDVMHSAGSAKHPLIERII